MMRWRLRDLARKLFSGTHLQPELRPARRRAAISLRLEALEERAVTTAVSIAPPVLLAPLAPAPAPVATSAQPTGNPPGGTGNAINQSLDTLLQAAYQTEMRVAEPGVGTLSAALDVHVSFDAVLDNHMSLPSSANTAMFEPATSTIPSLNVVEQSVSKSAISESSQALQTMPTAHRGAAAVAPTAEHGTVQSVPDGTALGAANGAVTQAQQANSATTQIQAVGVNQVSDLTVANSWNPTTVDRNIPAQGKPVSQVEVGTQPAPRAPDANGTLRLTVEDQADGSLLRRYVVNQEQAAFTALVQRHQRLVQSICRQVLGDSHAAEDAFQATFLVLARRAGAMEWRGPLTGWLYKVAYHLSLRVRAVNARQRLAEKLAAAEQPEPPRRDSDSELEREEMRLVVNEELERLPEKYRVPLVLCFLAGLTHEQAASEMGLPRGSMAKRIAEALKHLRRRLLGRGLTL